MNSISTLIIIIVTATMAISAVALSGSILSVTSVNTSALQMAQAESYYVNLVASPAVLSEQTQSFYVTVTFNLPSNEYAVFQLIPDDQLQSPGMNLGKTLNLAQLGLNSTERIALGLSPVLVSRVYGLSGQILNTIPEKAYLIKPHTTVTLTLNYTEMSELNVNPHTYSLVVWVLSKVGTTYYAVKYYYYPLSGELVIPG
ncbi:hypothetical protein HS1genome_2225 [Sulfodiicoccus acidiphilus]|uniref:Uncharacterized protein n=1 Tax=Sulfodiicoccus acidiphilus TaxID=1670455 RepID=A0A348B6N4_9CREN|nr:hypothetical protein [Sulfodiicoccus acidiphilus]BBD73836.1 hypothetical protein HS1genome_2225 [Sulfodiicoccus acidiphilus]GGT96405.1 hypothetical protein GCM10007116_12490 [Sulfodiicoccus acidiphilus]